MMQSILSADRSRDEPRWGFMILMSFLLHAAFLFAAYSLPTGMPRTIMNGPVYEVDLVQLPSGSAGKPSGRAKPASSRKSGDTSVENAAPAKRISPSKREEKPVVLAKRTVERKKTEDADREALARLEKAMAEIKKRKREEEEARHLEEAFGALKTREESSDSGVIPGEGRSAEHGISFRMYCLMVEEQVKSNWSYPVALAGSKAQELEAVVELKVKSDGTVLDSRFLKRSPDSLFNQSVSKAVDRTEKIPPFPGNYAITHNYEYFEVNFNLKELLDE